MLQDLFESKDKAGFVEELLDRENIDYESQEFMAVNEMGKNFIGKKKGKLNERIVISAHYDGKGAYDNASGVEALSRVIKSFRSYNPIHTLEYVFFDMEERNLLGSINYMINQYQRNEKIVQHLDIDGLGIGKSLVGLGYRDYIWMEVGNRALRIACTADFKTFGEKGISAVHIFSLPENEAEKFVRKQIWPATFDILHTPEDNLDKIKEKDLEVNVQKLISLIKEVDMGRGYLENSKIYLL